MEFSERYLPNGWTRTVEEISSNLERLSWPVVEEINDNIFGLAVDIETNLDDEPTKSWEDVLLSFKYENNEIYLTQHKSYFYKDKNDGLKIFNENNNGKEFVYKLKVVDNSTGSIMYYKFNLERVEVGQRIVKEVKKDLFDEHLEVIARLDDDEDNPFDTKFEDIRDSED